MSVGLLVSELDPSILSDALSELIAFDAQGRAVWPAKQLDEMLGEPLTKFGLKLHPAMADLTLRQLLEQPNPPIDLLLEVKNLSKHAPKGLFPLEMILLLYYGSIAAAMVRCGRRISKLPDEDLRNGFTWAIKQPWVPENIRELFRQATSKLSGGQKWRE